MKKACHRLIVFSLLTLVISPDVCIAGDDFFDVLSWAIKGSGTNKTIDAGMYGALATMAWNDANQNGDMDEGELSTEEIQIYDRDGNLAVQAPSGLTRDEIEAWAIDNFDLILGAIFPGGLNMSTGDTADSIMLGLSFGEKLSKASPARKATVEGLSVNNEFKGALEYLHLSVNDEDGDAYSILIGYNHEFEGGAELGILLPYRYTTMDDAIDSESHFTGLSISGKYPIKKWDSMVWDAGVEAFGSAYYLTSDAIEHAGNLQYGGGLFSTFTKTFRYATVSVGADYRISETEIRESWIDTDNQFVDKFIDYLKDLDTVKTFTYGFNIGVPLFADAMAVNLEVIRSNFSSDDIPEDRDSQTTVGLSFSYCPSDTFELNVGIRQTYELEDIELTGIYLGSEYRF